MTDLRDRAVEAFRGAGLECSPPEGGCYLVAETDEDCLELARRLASAYGVLVVPGRLFMADRGQPSGFVRIAFNKPAEDIAEAARRLVGSGQGVR
jgi:aminotransferase